MIVILKVVLLMMMMSSPLVVMKYLVEVVISPDLAVVLTFMKILFCSICFFTSHQQSFSNIGTGLPRLNQY